MKWRKVVNRTVVTSYEHRESGDLVEIERSAAFPGRPAVVRILSSESGKLTLTGRDVPGDDETILHRLCWSINEGNVTLRRLLAIDEE